MIEMVCRNIIRMWNLAQFSNPLSFSRSNVSRDNPAHAHKRDRWGEMASFCILIFEEQLKWENESARVIWCMLWVLHSNRTTTAKKTDLTSLKCIQFCPIEDLLLADYDFVFRINYLFGEGMGENVSKWMNWTGKICWYSHPEDSKVYPIPLDSLHKNICIFNFEHISRKTPEG